MKPKTIVKIILDTLMTALFIVLLFFVEDTGLVFHEIVGLSVLFAFGLHLGLNGSWIISTTKRLWAPKKFRTQTMPKKTSWMYFLNTLLLVGMITIIITGLMISRVILPQDGYQPLFVHIHEYAAYITGTLLIVHIALHARYLKNSIAKILGGFKIPIIRRTVSGAFAAVAILGIFYYTVIATLNRNIYGDTSVPAQIQREDAEATIAAEQTPEVSLSEFLSKMYCTLCPKNCPLSHPQCNKSRNLITAAKSEYQQKYNVEDNQLDIALPTPNTPGDNSASDPDNTQRESRQNRGRDSRHR